MDRPTFGHREIAIDPTKSVFIRSALESGTLSEPRVARIVRASENSRYSIHDLSRCTGEGIENIARFNMPLELGMAMARRLLEPSTEHDWLVLVPRGHPYARFVSDLAAYDPLVHDGSVPSVVIAVMSWLATRPDAIPTATPREVLALLPTFQSRRQTLNEAWGGLPPWAHILVLALEIAKQLG